MSIYVRFCENCHSKDPNYTQKGSLNGRYSSSYTESNYTCDFCGGKLIDLPMLSEDFRVLKNINNEDKFIKEMLDLYKENIIEYTTKINQFKQAANQRESQRAAVERASKIYQEREYNRKHSSQYSNSTSTVSSTQCPYCHSTNVKKITMTSKVTHGAIFGLFGARKILKQWHCNNCKSDF